MRAQLSSLHERLGVTTIYVTHDQIEAMTLGTRVAVLKDGELMQVDTPQMLFDAPDNLFVATFIGSPAMNLVEPSWSGPGPGAGVRRPQGPRARRAGQRPPGLDGASTSLHGRRAAPLLLEDAATPLRWPRIKGEVAVTEELGSEVNVIFHMAAPVHHEVMIARFDKAAKDEVEAEELAAEGQSLWTARVNPKTQAQVGRSIDLAVDTGGFHFFDADTGQAIGRTEGEAPRSDGKREVDRGVTEVTAELRTDGRPMAGRLSSAGRPGRLVADLERTPRRWRTGPSVASSPAEAGSKADVASPCWPTAALEEVVLGRDGLAEGLGSGGLLIDMSTTGPAPARRWPRRWRNGVSGSSTPPWRVRSARPPRARWPSWSVGPTRPWSGRGRCWRCSATRRTWHRRPVGAGQAAKLMVNLVLGGVTAAVAEGTRSGRCSGCPRRRPRRPGGASVATQTVRSKRDMLRSGDYGDPGFRLALMHKDLRLAVDAAQAARASLPGTERVAELYAGAKGRPRRPGLRGRRRLPGQHGPAAGAHPSRGPSRGGVGWRT